MPLYLLNYQQSIQKIFHFLPYLPKKGRCFWVLVQQPIIWYSLSWCTGVSFQMWNHSSHTVLRKTWKVNAFTWLYKAWLWFLLISRWLDASFTNHSNCAFLSGKVFITSRAKTNRAISSIWRRLHGRHGLAARTARVIWKTGISKWLMRRRKSTRAERSHAHAHSHTCTLLMRTWTDACRCPSFYFPYVGQFCLQRK